MGLLSHICEKYSDTATTTETTGLLSHIREKYSDNSKNSIDKEFLQKNVEENIKDCFAILYEINLSDLNSQDNIDCSAERIAETVNQLFPLPNVCVPVESSIRAIYYCDEDFDTEMFEFHLKNTIENAVGKSKTDCLKYSDFCLTDDKEKVLSHVLG